MTPAASWKIKMLYDGQCPVCSREAALLRRKDSRGQIAFEDITEPSFDPTRYGLTMQQVVGAMHGVRADGSIVRGIDVFAEIYDALGWRWLARPLRWRLTRPLAKMAYRVFAKLRPRFSGFKPDACDSGACSPKA